MQFETQTRGNYSVSRNQKPWKLLSSGVDRNQSWWIYLCYPLEIKTFNNYCPYTMETKIYWHLNVKLYPGVTKRALKCFPTYGYPKVISIVCWQLYCHIKIRDPHKRLEVPSKGRHTVFKATSTKLHFCI